MAISLKDELRRIIKKLYLPLEMVNRMLRAIDPFWTPPIVI
jgi:hypothetical protein